MDAGNKRLSERQALAAFGAEKIRCPKCGHKFSASNFLRDRRDAIVKVVKQGQELLVLGFGTFFLDTVYGRDMHDLHFHPFAKTFQTIGFKPSRSITSDFSSEPSKDNV